MLRLLTVSAILSAAVWAGACDPYDPDLGAIPYRCGKESPKCPDGYAAVDVSSTLCECRLPGTTGPAPDAAVCSGTALEPNDTVVQATPSPVGETATTTAFNGQSICTLADVDVYAFNLKKDRTITATITFNPAAGALKVYIIDAASTRLAESAGAAGSGKQIVTWKAAGDGKYYAQVATSGVANNYDLALSVDGL